MSVARDRAMSIGFAVMAAATIGCATSGHAFPSTPGDPRTTIGRATSAIDAAASAGADTLAADAMRAGRQHLADAQIEFRDKHNDRAGLRARQAAADALYAKAQAERVMAERARTTEQARLDQIPAVPASSTPKTAAVAPPPGEP
jgi:hypothetical protein